MGILGNISGSVTWEFGSNRKVSFSAIAVVGAKSRLGVAMVKSKEIPDINGLMIYREYSRKTAHKAQ